MRAFLIGTAMVLALAAGGCRMANSGDNSSNAAAPVASDWPTFVNNFIEARFRANPGFAVSQGRHEFDGQIADL